MHSFVHPRVVKMGVEPLQGDVLTITVATGNQVLCSGVAELDFDLFCRGWRPPGSNALLLYVLERL